MKGFECLLVCSWFYLGFPLAGGQGVGGGGGGGGLLSRLGFNRVSGII